MPASRSTWCTVLLLGLFCLWAWMALDGLRLLDRSHAHCGAYCSANGRADGRAHSRF